MATADTTTKKKRKRTASPKRQPSRHSLDAIFRPRAVAVIGASRREQSIGREILRNVVDFGYTGPCYPVNPNAEAVHSMRAYPRLSDVPGPVDLAVIVVPRDRVLPVVDECGKKGVQGIVVITAGFKEVGDQGRGLELKLRRKLEQYGIRMVGPNCMGVINTEESVRLNATFAAAVPPRGNIGLISQSGALGEAILADASDSGIGVSMFVSMGNKTDISGNDLLEYWEKNDDVQVVLMYLESFGNPRKFTQLARRITRKKPVITVKAGRTAAGARAASSHTGSIVGLDVATDSLLEQCGVLRVNSLEQMFVQAAALANQPVPKGGRIAIVTNAGGPGILCTDSLSGRGVELSELRPETRKALGKVLPAEASTANPIDMIASADAARYRAVLDIVKRDRGVDGIIAIFVSPIMIDAFEVARAIAEASDGSKPILSVFMGKNRSTEGLRELARHRVPVYRFPEEAASAMWAMVHYHKLRDAPIGKSVRFEVDRARALKIIRAARRQGRTALSFGEAHDLLAAYGFPMARSLGVGSTAEAIAAAQDVGYPVVLKIDSEDYSHKTDVGGVKVDLRNGDEVGAAFRDLETRLGKRGKSTRVRVQHMVQRGRELILGMTRDDQFGPLLMFGLGGVFVEVMRDVSVRIHPLTDVDARSMIEQLQGYPLLAGARGDKPVAIPLIQELLLRLSQMVGDLEDHLAELDVNPLIVTDRRDTSFVVDARVTLIAD